MGKDAESGRSAESKSGDGGRAAVSTAIGPWRRRAPFVALALFTGLPFLEIGGESALRFDVPSLRLFFFGSVVRIDELFSVLLLLLVLTFLFIWLTVVYGRIWCGP